MLAKREALGSVVRITLSKFLFRVAAAVAATGRNAEGAQKFDARFFLFKTWPWQTTA